MIRFVRIFFIIFTLIFQSSNLICMGQQPANFPTTSEQKTDKPNYFDSLSEEMIVHILSFLTLEDIKLTTQKIDRKFYRICQDKEFTKLTKTLKDEIAQKENIVSKVDTLLSKIEEEGRENKTATLIAMLLDKDLRKILSIEDMAHILNASITVYHTFEAATKILQTNPNLIEKIENQNKKNKWLHEYYFFFNLLKTAINKNQVELTKQLLENSPNLFTYFKSEIINPTKKLIDYANQAKQKQDFASLTKIFDEKILAARE